MLWYVKGQYTGRYTWDHVISEYEGKNHHIWQQSTVEARHFISRLTEPGDTVCDPFAGSGTTGLACLQLGDRNFIGVEKEKQYYNIIQKRLQQAAMQTKLSVF